jgi:hypothetical protein
MNEQIGLYIVLGYSIGMSTLAGCLAIAQWVA